MIHNSTAVFRLMKTRYWSLPAGTAAALLSSSIHTARAAQNREPNFIIILTNDMGIDSAAALNPKSNIPMPNIDKLIQQILQEDHV